MRHSLASTLAPALRNTLHSAFSDSLQCPAESFKYCGVVAAEHHVVVADRGLQEVVAADGHLALHTCTLIQNCPAFDLHRDLSAAEALLVWVASDVGLANELSAKVAGQFENCRRTFRHFAVDGDSDT